MDKSLRHLTCALVAVLFGTYAGPLIASRLVYENIGQVKEIAAASGDIKIDGTSYRLAKKVVVHSTEKGANSTTVNSLRPGMTVGYTSTRTDPAKKPEISSIWVLPNEMNPESKRHRGTSE